MAYTSLYYFRLPFVTKETLFSFFFLHELIFPRRHSFVTNVRWPHYQLPEILQAEEEEEEEEKNDDKIRIYVAYNSHGSHRGSMRQCRPHPNDGPHFASLSSLDG